MRWQAPLRRRSGRRISRFTSMTLCASITFAKHSNAHSTTAACGKVANLQTPKRSNASSAKEWMYTSSVCVLIGTHTWCRRWVRYEMARAVIDKRGLLGVHINGLNHHGRLHADALGINPLDQMAVGKVLANAFAVPRSYLFEWGAQGSWVRYQDHQLPIVKPSYLLDPPPGYLIQLSTGAKVYDFDRQDGPANIGSWIDYAAQQVRR